MSKESEPETTATASNGAKKQAKALPGLGSLFSAAASAAAEKSAAPRQGPQATAHHEKKIGMAPPGTRRAMGKR